MKRKITFLIAAAVMLLTMVATTGELWGQTNAKVYTLTPESSNAGTSSNYAAATDIICNSITWNVKGNTSGTPWLIGGNSITGVDRPIYSKTAITGNVSRIAIYHGNKDNELTVNSMTVTIHNNADDAASGDNPIATYNPAFAANDSIIITKVDATSWENKYYRIVYNITKNNTGNKKFQFTKAIFYKTIYSVTYNDNGATGGIAPNTTTHDAGSDITIAYNTGSLVRIGFNFSGWNTQADGEGTDYAEGATINNIAQDYTLYAKWTSASTPNIVVSGNDISNNTLNLVYTESGDKTANASFNNMPEYTNPSVALFDDLSCETTFSGDWFSASLNGSTITYNASANPGAARTVYMRVSAVYDEITYYSNVITVTQAALPCTVTYNKNDEGASGEMEDDDSPYAYGSTVTVLDNEFTAPTGKVFYKWNTKADASGQWYEANDTFEITENTTLYAQWNDIPKYVYVTSLSQVIPGKHYILASSITKDTKADVMDAQNGSTYRDKKTTTTYIAKGDVDGDGNDDIYIQEDGLYEFVISGDMSVEISEETYISYTIYDKTNKGYLCNSGSTNLSVNTTAINDASRWVLEFWKDTNDDIRLKIRNVDVTGNYLQYNSSSPRYKTYTGSQKHPFLYMKYDDNDCEIYSATTLSKNESYTNLTIVKDTYVNGSVTVPNNKTLNVSGTLTNNGTAANLIIEDGGQLITSNSVAATIVRNITSAESKTVDDHWYTIASSVNAPTFVSVTNLTTDGTYDLYRYDEESYTWQNSKKIVAGNPQFSSFQNGRGYLYRKAGSEKIKYEGDVNVGDLTYTLMTYASENESVKGFNLIGNPFPHDIYKGYGGAIDESKLSDKFYYLDDNSTWQIGTYETPIKPGMGIMVQTNSAGDITIKDDNTAATAEKAPAAKASVNEMMFTIANSQYKDAVYAVFDNGYGLYKLEHQNTEAPMAYITQNNKRYGSAMMSDDVRSFNLNFKAKALSLYTLSCKAFGEFDYVHVIDRLTGEDIDILLEGEYSFIGTPEDMENRFIVKLGSSADNNENDVFVFQNGNDIVVNGEGELQIFDVTGRMISTQRVSGIEFVAKPSQTGVYIFRIVGETVKTQKIVVE